MKPLLIILAVIALTVLAFNTVPFLGWIMVFLEAVIVLRRLNDARP